MNGKRTRDILLTMITGFILFFASYASTDDHRIYLTTDTDADGILDSVDNCTLRPNPDQRDTNNDGYGNLCDPDTNNDGIVAFGDMASWIPLFGTACGDVDADFNGDGQCNFGDYALFPQFFLQPPGPAAIDNP